MTSSLIITTYNRPDALELVLLSVLQQTHLPNEVIIADDGSTSKTQALIATYQATFPVPLIHSWQADKGFKLAESRNLALKKAQYEYIIMIDGDMVLERHFIQDHLKVAKKGRFVQGRRVILDAFLTEQALQTKQIKYSFFSSHLSNRLNAVHCSFLMHVVSSGLSKKDQRSVRGCNMAYWREDALIVNGYNQDFIGWGREDSEFVVRLLNLGLHRFDLRFGGIGYHLFHPESTRTMLPQNDAILEQTISQKLSRCPNGIDQL